MEKRRKITLPDAPPLPGIGGRRERPEAETRKPEPQSRQQAESAPVEPSLQAGDPPTVTSPPLIEPGGERSSSIRSKSDDSKAEPHPSSSTESLNKKSVPVTGPQKEPGAEPREPPTGEVKKDDKSNEGVLWLAVIAAMTLVLMAFIFELGHRNRASKPRQPAQNWTKIGGGKPVLEAGKQQEIAPESRNASNREKAILEEGLKAIRAQQEIANNAPTQTQQPPRQPSHSQIQPVFPNQIQTPKSPPAAQRVTEQQTSRPETSSSDAHRTPWPDSVSSHADTPRRATPTQADIEREFIPVPIVARLRVVNVKSNDTLSIRSGPSSSTTKIGAIPHNAAGIGLLSRNHVKNGRDFWFQIFWRGTKGWVNGNYVDHE